LHVSPAASIIAFRSSISSSGHTSPWGIWWRAVTMPVAPACLISCNETVSAGPYHRHACSSFFAMSFICFFSLCFFLFGYPDALHLLSTYSHAHKFTTSHTTPSVESAIHQNGLARNESRCIAQQEDQCPSELLRIAQTAECRIVNKPLRPIGIRPIGVREQCAVLFRKEYTGGNSIYPHFITIALCQFHGHPLGVSFNRTLRHIVTHNASNCLLCGQRRNV